jgi:hypothetical protein
MNNFSFSVLRVLRKSAIEKHFKRLYKVRPGLFDEVPYYTYGYEKYERNSYALRLKPMYLNDIFKEHPEYFHIDTYFFGEIEILYSNGLIDLDGLFDLVKNNRSHLINYFCRFQTEKSAKELISKKLRRDECAHIYNNAFKKANEYGIPKNFNISDLCNLYLMHPDAMHNAVREVCLYGSKYNAGTVIYRTPILCMMTDDEIKNIPADPKILVSSLEKCRRGMTEDLYQYLEKKLFVGSLLNGQKHSVALKKKMSVLKELICLTN